MAGCRDPSRHMIAASRLSFTKLSSFVLPLAPALVSRHSWFSLCLLSALSEYALQRSVVPDITPIRHFWPSGSACDRVVLDSSPAVRHLPPFTRIVKGICSPILQHNDRNGSSRRESNRRQGAPAASSRVTVRAAHPRQRAAEQDRCLPALQVP